MRQLTPLLRVIDLDVTLQFYTDRLGFTVCWRDGDTAQVENGGASLMFSTGENLGTKPRLSGTLYFHTDSVDELWESLRDRIRVEWELQSMDYGTREFGIRDPNGYILAFAQPLPAENE